MRSSVLAVATCLWLASTAAPSAKSQHSSPASEILERITQVFPENLAPHTTFEPARLQTARREIVGLRPQHPDPTPPSGLGRQELEAWTSMSRRGKQSALAPFFPNTYGDAFVVEAQGVRVVLRPLDANPAPVETVAGKIVYREAYPETDVLHTASSHRAEEFLLLRSPEAPLQFEYAVEEVLGATEIWLREGKVRFTDVEGRGLAIEKPWLVDAAGRRSEEAVWWELGDERPDGTRRLTLRLEPEGLRYPLAIDPTWTPTGDLIWRVRGHTATLLNDGKVLVVGGDDGSSYPALSQIYDPATGTWSLTPWAPFFGRSNHTATLLADGRVLVAGGFNGVYETSVEIYDPLSGTWTFPFNWLWQGRAFHTATRLADGRVLVTGGFDGSYVGPYEIFDPVTEFWWPAPGPARAKHTATLLTDGKVLIAGGEDAGGALASSELYDPLIDFWAPTAGSMSAARISHTATLLTDGRVLVACGHNGPVSLSSAEIYDPATELWSVTGSLSVARTRHTATLLSDGRVMVVGGFDGTSYLQSVETFDPLAGIWSPEKELGQNRQEHTATLLTSGAVLVAGGWGLIDGWGFSALRSSELFQPSSPAPAWLATGDMASTRQSHTATLLQNGQVLVVAGAPFDETTSELYNPGSGTWSNTGSLTQGRSRHTATLLRSGKVLVAGGEAGGAATASAEIYDSTTGNWGATGGLNFPRRRHTATRLADGRVLVAGGEDGSGSSLDVAELYDPVSGSWSVTGNLNVARDGHTATVLADGRVLVAGGNSPAALNTAEVFDPGMGGWQLTTSPMNYWRDGHTATLLEDAKVLVVGGTGSPGSEQTSELYDPSSDIWTVTAGALNAARVLHSATLLPNGRVLVAAGFFAGGSSEIYDPALGAWSASASLNEARRDHTATLLPDGDVLVTGGTGFGPLRSAELFRSSTPSWSLRTNQLNQAREAASATLLPDGRLLIAGGYDTATSSALSTSELYDPITDSWALTTGSLSTIRYLQTATLLPGGKVLVAGGLTPASTSTAELFDPTSQTWSPSGSMNESRYGHTATLLLNGKVLVAGGWGSNSAELYDPIQQTWSMTGSMSTARRYHTATLLLNGNVLVAGGSNGFGFLTSAEIYDPATGTWTPTGDMVDSRDGHTATLLSDGRVIVAGGLGSFFSEQKSELYDPGTGSWSPSGNLAVARNGQHRAVLLSNGRVLLVGGSTPNSGTIYAELYDPRTGTWTLTDSLFRSRTYHVAALLPNGNVLAAGGAVSSGGGPWTSLDSVEIFDPGLGFTGFRRPALSSVTDPLPPGVRLVATGSQFEGIYQASGGNGSASSPTNHPLVQLRRLDNEAIGWLPVDAVSGWSNTSFTSIPVAGVQAGHALATVFTNGIPSLSRSLYVECAAPAITSQPTAQSVCQAGTAVFTVAATGECLSYRWRRNGVPLTDGGHYSGTATATLTVSMVDASDLGNYDVAVSSPCSSSTATSSPVLLSIQHFPPTFAGLSSVTEFSVPCRLRLDWPPASSSCPTTPGIRYNVYRSTTSGFIPGPATLIASCVNALFYEDSAGIVSGTTYHYVVRAEDSSSGFGGPCNGGFEDFNQVERSVSATCTSAPATPTDVSFFTVTSTNGRNKLEWLNPSMGPYGSTTIRYRTDAFPSGPGDGLPVTDQGAAGPGAYDFFEHTGLPNNATYYYAAFVHDGSGNYSAGRFVKGRPFDTPTEIKWAYSTGAAAMAPPGLIPVIAVSNDRVLHSMNRGPTGGDWPSGWVPFALNAPAQARPPVVPLPVGGATRVVFLGSQDGHVYAVDGNTGALVWRSPNLGEMVQAAPAGIFTAYGGAQSLILVGVRNSLTASAFYGLNLADGSIAWTFTNSLAQGGDGLGMGMINGGAAVDYANTRVYFASYARSGGSSNSVWCVRFDGTSATFLWARSLGNVTGSPVLRGGRLYVGTNGSKVHALDADTGADLWADPFDCNDGPVKGFIWPDRFSNKLYLTTTNTVWSLADDIGTVSENWRVTAIPFPSIPLFTYPANLLLVGSSDGYLYQLDAATPLPVKRVRLGDGTGAVGSPAFDAALGLAYVGTDAGAVYGVTIPIQ